MILSMTISRQLYYTEYFVFIFYKSSSFTYQTSKIHLLLIGSTSCSNLFGLQRLENHNVQKEQRRQPSQSPFFPFTFHNNKFINGLQFQWLVNKNITPKTKDTKLWFIHFIFIFSFFFPTETYTLWIFLLS